MMQIFASDLLSSLSTATSKSTLQSQDTNSAGSGQRIVPGNEIGIDIAVTKLPYFVDKSIAIEDSGAYAKGAQQVHLTGYDTLIRILDPKYYPPSHTLNSLHAFLSKHRLRVTYRTDDSWGERASQDQFLKELGEGKLEGMGGKREWVTEKRIVMCEGRKEGEEIVSSTRVREAVRKGDRELLEKLATGGVAKWILGEGLYLEEEGKL
jgi:nicotinamide-nucleotide adenylyltransferase